MANLEEAGEFSYTVSSATVEIDEDGVTNTVNYEGTVTGYGTVYATLTYRASGADAKGGTAQAKVIAYLDDGEIVLGEGDGVFEECGKHQWRVRGLNRVSDGTVSLSDGVADLESRTLKGKFYTWE